MKTAYNDIPNDGLVFMFQANRNFSTDEAEIINQDIQQFSEVWLSHTKAVKNYAQIYFNRVIVFFVDDAFNAVGGCSKDSLHQFIKSLGEKYNINFFDRMQFLYWNADNQLCDFNFNEAEQLIQNEVLTADTLIVNHQVDTKAIFENNVKIPLKLSYFSKFLMSYHN
ncbi:MAG: hypothetical protein H6553_09140 [Chitinophagales bacterium]|nr:hypothetical protein [Chitinophagales bacterium]